MNNTNYKFWGQNRTMLIVQTGSAELSIHPEGNVRFRNGTEADSHYWLASTCLLAYNLISADWNARFEFSETGTTHMHKIDSCVEVLEGSI